VVIKRVVGGLIVPKLLLLTDDLVDIFVFVFNLQNNSFPFFWANED